MGRPRKRACSEAPRAVAPEPSRDVTKGPGVLSELERKAAKARPLPLREVLRLDRVGDGEFVLTNLVTLEQVNMACAVELEIDEETGDALLLTVDETGAPEVKTVESILSMAAYNTDDGDILIKTGGADDEGGAPWFDTSTMMAKYEGSDVKIDLGGGAAQASFFVASFARARPGGLHMWWSLSDVYSYLKLKCFKGFASRWISRARTSWYNFWDALSGIAGADHMVHSVDDRGERTTIDNMPWASRCLPVTCASSFALMANLLRWYCLAPNQGGLCDRAQREASATLFSALLRRATGNASQMSLRICLFERWECQWPRPPPTVDGDMVVEITVEGRMVDFRPIQDAARRSDSRVSQTAKLWRCMSDALGAKAALEMMIHKDILRGIIGQILMAAARSLENVLSATARGDGAEGISMQNKEFREQIANDGGPLLLSYIRHGREQLEATAGSSWFIATDGGSIWGLKLQHTFLVDSAVDTEEPEVQTQGMKRKAEEASAVGLTVKQMQEMQWTQRYKGGPREGWRSTPLHRVAAKKWLSNVDAQVRQCSPLPGLIAFIPSAAPVWAPKRWRDWPHLTVCADLGSDGLAACMAAERKWFMNLDLVGDHSHGANRDIVNSLKASSMFSFYLCMMISWNVPFGPNRDDVRYEEMRSALRATLLKSNWTDILFGSMVNGLADCYRRLGHTFSASEPLEAQVWEKLKERKWFVKEGYRGILCRFQALSAVSLKHTPNWEIDQYERTACGLMQGYLRGSGFVARMQLRADAAEAQVDGSTDNSRVSFEDKSLKSVCANAVALSVVMLNDPQNRRACCAISGLMRPLLDWHCWQIKELRSPAGNMNFQVSQVAEGGYMDHICATMGLLVDPAFLLEAGLITDLGWMAKLPDGDVGLEDELCATIGDFGCALVCARLKRALVLLCSWPSKMTKLLGSPAVASQTVKDFKKDYEVWKAFDEFPNKDGELALLSKRSCFQKTSVKQFVTGFEQPEVNWSAHEDVKSLVGERCGGLGATTMCEEAINVAKNNRRKYYGKRWRKPETIMRTILASGLMESRHEYRTVQLDSINTKKTDTLTQAAFMQNADERSVRFQDIVSASSGCEWWSPAAQGLSAPAADLNVLSDLKARFSLASSCWLGRLFSIKYRFAFRFDRDANSRPNKWFLPLGFCDNSAVVAWPVLMVKANQNGDAYFQPEAKLAEPVLVTISSMRDIKAVPFEWRSPVFQFHNYTKHFQKTPLGIRPFATGPPVNVLQVAARAGFWDLPKSFLDDLADLYHYEKTPTLFQALVSMVGNILEVDETAALEHCSKRLAATDLDAFHAAALAEVDSGIEVLDQRDHDEVKATVKDAENAGEVRHQFSKEYQASRASIRSTASVATSSRKADGKRARTSTSSGSRPPAPLPSPIPQGLAKQYIPEGASIWRSVTRSAWCGHMKPRARISEPWQRHGSDEAALRVIVVRLWRQFMEIQGLGPSEIPYVLPAPCEAREAAGGAAGVASSSSSTC